MTKALPYLGTVEDPKPPLKLVSVQSPVKWFGNIQCIVAFRQIGIGRVLPSTERRVRLIALLRLGEREQHDLSADGTQWNADLSVAVTSLTIVGICAC